MSTIEEFGEIPLMGANGVPVAWMQMDAVTCADFKHCMATINTLQQMGVASTRFHLSQLQEIVDEGYGSIGNMAFELKGPWFFVRGLDAVKEPVYAIADDVREMYPYLMSQLGEAA